MNQTLETLVAPDPMDPRLTERVEGIDHEGKPVTTSVTVERPLTLFLNCLLYTSPSPRDRG